MRHQWRFLLFRNYPRSSLQFTGSSYYFQVPFNPNLTLHESLHTLSSLLPTSSHTFYSRFSRLPICHSRFINLIDPKNPNFRNPMICSYSSEPAIEQKESDFTVVSDIFYKFSDVNDISKQLELSGVVFTHEMVLKVLKNLESSPDEARRFFNWVLEKESERLSSKTYNLMLRIVGVHGLVQEFWGLVDVMKKKGYGVASHVRNKMTEKFEKEGLESDLEKLKGIFATGSIDNSIEKVASRICKVVRSDIWGDDVERQLRDLNVTFSNDLVKFVVDKLGDEPKKALIFFRWAEESGFVKHDESSYNAMASVLGREDCIDRFWKVLDEMRSKGYEMEMETCVKVLGRFSERNMVKEAVDLYEFAMACKNKPSVNCCTFLLRKIVVSKQLDMRLFSKVVRVFRENGNVLTDAMLNSVLKALISVGRMGECNKILKAMEEGGFIASSNMKSKIAFRLSSAGKKDEANEFMDHMEASGSDVGDKMWVSLIKGHCVAGDLDKAADCFQKMVEKEGTSHAGYAIDLLVNTYCSKNRAIDACKFVHNCVCEYDLKPWHTTYKELIKNLLVQRGFKDALSLLCLMKDHGFPPFVDPFIKYVSKSGTSDDAIAFLKGMTSKRFPSMSVVLCLFEAFFQARRHSEAQDLLSKCPRYIRNHADVLNLLYSKKSGGDSAPAVTA